jgi:CheY-like chemotaxis protein
MATAMSQKSYIDRAFAAGATDYITKPFDFLEVGTRLNLAQKQVENTEHANAQLQGSFDPVLEGKAAMSHSLCEPIEILGVDHVVGYVAFDNYVMQLTRSHLFLSSVYAVKIVGIEKIYASCSTAEFKTLIVNVAKSIVDCTDPLGSLLSYRGNGVFLCMNHKGSKQAHLDLEKTLGKKAEAIYGPAPIDGAQPSIQLILGEQVSLGVIFRAGSLAHLRRAIDNVETKARFLQDMEGVLDENTFVEDRDLEVLEQKKVGYEAFLRESLSEGMSLQEMRQP